LPSNSTRNTLARQWELLRQLPSKGPGITRSDLLERMKDAGYRVTKRTIERDLVELSRLFPLTCNDGGVPFAGTGRPASVSNCLA